MSKICGQINYKKNYNGYKNSLRELSLESLEERRQKLTRRMTKKLSEHEKTKDLFPLNDKTHTMLTRKTNKYKIYKSNTERLRRSAVIKMQHILNTDN